MTTLNKFVDELIKFRENHPELAESEVLIEGDVNGTAYCFLPDYISDGTAINGGRNVYIETTLDTNEESEEE